MKTVKKVGTVNYANMVVPRDYKCDDCGAIPVRLWRQYQTAVSQTKLLCTACAEHDQKNCHSEGWCSSYFLGRGLSIGWYVPAIPMQGRDTYWSHAAAPAKALDWWNKLPEKKDTKNTNFVAVVF